MSATRQRPRPGQHRLGRLIFHLVAGPDGESERARIHGTVGPRWFPRDSAIATVHGDAAMFVGGIRAVVMQSLHPVAMQAVADHSGYRGDLWGRLARTATFLATTTFGPATLAQEAVDRVRRIHDHVTGTMPDTTPYAASDPHLLAWIHAAEIDSFLTAHQAYGVRRLSPGECDAYVAQTGEVAGRLGVLSPPRTERELRATLEAFRPELRASQAALDAMSYLRTEPPLSPPARLTYAVLWAAAIDLLPPWARAELRLPAVGGPARRLVRPGGRAAVATIRWALRPGQEATRRIEPVTP